MRLEFQQELYIDKRKYYRLQIFFQPKNILRNYF